MCLLKMVPNNQRTHTSSFQVLVCVVLLSLWERFSFPSKPLRKIAFSYDICIASDPKWEWPLVFGDQKAGKTSRVPLREETQYLPAWKRKTTKYRLLPLQPPSHTQMPNTGDASSPSEKTKWVNLREFIFRVNRWLYNMLCKSEELLEGKNNSNLLTRQINSCHYLPFFFLCTY